MISSVKTESELINLIEDTMVLFIESKVVAKSVY